MATEAASWNQAIIDEFHSAGGTVRYFGRNLVLLHHTGTRSGSPRVSPLLARHPDPDTWLLSASASGADKNPDWYHNLLAHPEVRIETPDDGTVEVRAYELAGAERDAAWAQFVAFSDRFAGYQNKTSRTIPVLELRRR